MWSNFFVFQLENFHNQLSWWLWQIWCPNQTCRNRNGIYFIICIHPNSSFFSCLWGRHKNVRVRLTQRHDCSIQSLQQWMPDCRTERSIAKVGIKVDRQRVKVHAGAGRSAFEQVFAAFCLAAASTKRSCCQQRFSTSPSLVTFDLMTFQEILLLERRFNITMTESWLT